MKIVGARFTSMARSTTHDPQPDGGCHIEVGYTYPFSCQISPGANAALLIDEDF
jgi:hypothetical protein